MNETSSIPVFALPLRSRIAAFELNIPDAPPKNEDAVAREYRELLERIFGKFPDLPYARLSPAQRLDLYLPNERTESRCPVIVCFCGGTEKRSDAALSVLRGLERGYAVVCANYREGDAAVQDAKAVIRWVRASAERYGLDRQRIAAWGIAEGAWLASFLTVTNGNRQYEASELGNAEFSSQVQACVDWCGACAEEKLLAHIRSDAAPFLLLHGGEDRVVAAEQSVRFAEALNRLSGEGTASVYIAPGLTHQALLRCGERWPSDMSLDFLDGVFRRKKKTRATAQK